jgi:hypothetical protein
LATVGSTKPSSLKRSAFVSDLAAVSLFFMSSSIAACLS